MKAPRFSGLPLFRSLRHFFHEKPGFFRAFLTVSRQHPTPWVSLSQAIRRFSVQRGANVASGCPCGGVAAASRLPWISPDRPSVIFWQKGGASARVPIKQAFMAFIVVAVHPAHHGLVVPARFLADLGRIFALGDFEQGQKALTGAEVFAVQGKVTQGFGGLAPFVVVYGQHVSGWFPAGFVKAA